MEINFIIPHTKEVVKTFLSLVNCVSYIYSMHLTHSLSKLHITLTIHATPSQNAWANMFPVEFAHLQSLNPSRIFHYFKAKHPVVFVCH
jgi:hypothetical protein